jgi:hypothetical protein
MLYLHNLLYNNEDHAVNDHIFGDMGAYISSKIHWLDRWPPCGNFNKKDHLLHQNVKKKPPLNIFVKNITYKFRS